MVVGRIPAVGFERSPSGPRDGDGTSSGTSPADVGCTIAAVPDPVPSPPATPTASALPDPLPRKLNLGCGWDKRDGYLNVDLHGSHDPDLVADVRQALDAA
jgi:hypothetical protein